jgi:RNA-directed DNA polymerase
VKTYNGLYTQIYSFENLWKAADQAQQGKRFQESVARFNLNRERELFKLQDELQSQTYKPGNYHEFTIYEPKKRMISAAPYRDRVIHHALCNIIEPIFERIFIFDSYACRVGKGTHKAVDRFTEFCRKNRYVLKADISKYFPSIDHEILKSLIRRKIRDEKTLWLINLIIDSSNPQEPVSNYFTNDDLFAPIERRHGIPIGNLTSQFYANVYLNALDHFIKEQLRCKYYIRYCDDFVVFSEDKDFLHEAREKISEYLISLRLKLHPHKCQVFPIKDGTDFLGYRIFPDYRLIRHDSIIRFRRRMQRLQEDYAKGIISLPHIRQSIQSWIGHVSHANSYGLRKKLLGNIKFCRGEAFAY